MTPSISDDRTHCNILVQNAEDPSVTYGFLKPVFNGSGGYGPLQATQAGALEVTFYVPSFVLSAGQLDLHAENGPSQTYPYFGATIASISSSDDFGSGSSNYAYASAARHTTPGWINSDGTGSTTYIVYADNGSDAILLTGDPWQLNGDFGTSFPIVTLTCVTPLTASEDA
ncbi:hypothetical protein FRB90_002843 [Tulasnella sp. 427]|nr:hypothetical protein FRB90_002843 [Tulasnella sp. 427]